MSWQPQMRKYKTRSDLPQQAVQSSRIPILEVLRSALNMAAWSCYTQDVAGQPSGGPFSPRHSAGSEVQNLTSLQLEPKPSVVLPLNKPLYKMRGLSCHLL